MEGASSLPNYKFYFPDDDAHASGFDEVPNSPGSSAFVVGVAGPSASGKTTVCRTIERKLCKKNTNRRIAIISQDSFYKVLTSEQIENVSKYNFDHPSALDFDLMKKCLEGLKKRRNVEIPKYDFTTHSRCEDTIPVYAPEVVLFEGILSFADPELRDMFDMKIFVDTDADTCLARRIRRDMAERGRTLDSILTQYETFVKPSAEDFVAPTKKYADVIIPRGADNHVAVDLVVQQLRSKLKPRPVRGKQNVGSSGSDSDPEY